MQKIKLILVLGAAWLGAVGVQASDAPANPLYAASPLPFEYPVFDKIKDSDFAPAFREGMQQRAAEIARIADNPQAPTFENTVVAMEQAGQLLGRTSRIFFNLKATLTNPVLEALERSIAPAAGGTQRRRADEPEIVQARQSPV